VEHVQTGRKSGVAITTISAGRDVVLSNSTLAPTGDIIFNSGVQFPAGAAASLFADKVEAFREEYLVNDQPDRSVPFGGRNDDLRRLDRWLADAGSPPRFLLSGPAGRGKSALLVRWIKSLQDEAEGADSHDRWRLVFMPISIRFNTNRPEIFYQGLAARLAQILGESLLPPPTNSVPYYEERIRALLDIVVERQMRVLLVIDGVDEALGGQFSAHWFPRAPGARLRIVVSARWQVDDLRARGWAERLRWTQAAAAESHELALLDHSAVHEVLIKSGGLVDALASRPEIIDRLYILSQGEPLLLRFYVEDLWGTPALERLQPSDLDRLQPGFFGYFADWLRRQREAWKSEIACRKAEEEVLAYLSVLACAQGPLLADELSDLTHRAHGVAKPLRTADELHAVRRFVVGTGRGSFDDENGFVLSHPFLSQFLREEYFDAGTIATVERAFLTWERAVIEQLNTGELAPEDAPVYVLVYAGQHLESTGASVSELMVLVEDGWRRAWYARERGYRGFSTDVARALRHLERYADETAISAHASDGGLPYLGEQIRCVLCLSSIGTLGASLSPSLLAQAVECRVLTARQAINLTMLKVEDAQREDALVALSKVIDPGEMHLLLAAVREIGDEYWRGEALSGIAPRLPDALLAEASILARGIKDPGVRATALSALMSRPPQLADAVAKLERQARKRSNRAALADPMDLVTAARSISDLAVKSQRLSELAAIVDEPLRAELVSEAVAAAYRIEDSSRSTEVICRLVPLLPDMAAPAFEQARMIAKPFPRALAMTELIPYLPEALRIEAASQALRVSRACTGYQRVTALSTLAARLPPSVQAQLIESNPPDVERGTTRVIASDDYEATKPKTSTRPLPRATAARALKKVHGMQSSRAQAKSLRPLVARLPEALLPKALGLARKIEEPQHRFSVLMTLVRRGTDATADALDTIRELIHEEEDEWELPAQDDVYPIDRVAKALEELVPFLSDALLPDALTLARGISDPGSRAAALAPLFHVSPGVAAEAVRDFERFRQLTDDSDEERWFTLEVTGRLVPSLPPELLDDALVITRGIENALTRSLALIVFVPRRPDLAAEVIETAVYLEEHDDWRWVVSQLALHVPAIAREALIAAKTLDESNSRREALRPLAPYEAEKLTESWVDGELAWLDKKASSDSDMYSWQLAKLATQLPQARLGEIVKRAAAMDDAAARATTFCEIMPFLPPDLQAVAMRHWLETAPALLRPTFFENLTCLLPVLASSSTPETFRTIQRAVSDTTRWWP
jgi:hypothetical protein